jgi:hypothetical protein
MNSQIFKLNSTTLRDKESFKLYNHNKLPLLLQYVSYHSVRRNLQTNIETTRSCIIWIELFTQIFISLSLWRQVYRPFQTQPSTKNDTVLHLQFAATFFLTSIQYLLKTITSFSTKLNFNQFNQSKWYFFCLL